MNSEIIDLLKEKQIKVTQNRINILQYLYDTKGFVSINDIQNKLQIDMSIVYRNIKLFLDKDIVLKELRNDMKHYYILNTHKHFLECFKCHDIQELDECPFKNDFEVGLNEKFGFQMTKHDIYLSGICKNCRKDNA